MSTITKEQIQAINAKCRNGFGFDTQDFVELNRKNLCKNIPIVEGRKVVKVSLGWTKETVRRSDGSTAGITGNVLPQLHCAVWEKCTSSTCWISHGIGVFHPFEDRPSPRKAMTELCKATELATDELILSLLPQAVRKELLP